MNKQALSDFIRQELSGWKPFEVLLLVFCVGAQLWLLIQTSAPLLDAISGITGTICVVLVSKGKISNYFFGLIFAYTYFYVAWHQNYIGEMNSVLYIYLPAQFIGYFLWKANMQKDNAGSEEVVAKALDFKGWAILLVSLTVLTLLFIEALKAAGGSSTSLDGVTTITTCAAQLLMILRYREQWLLWIVLNVLSILLWWEENPSMRVMYIAYLVNSIYGFYNWTKLQKQLKA